MQGAFNFHDSHLADFSIGPRKEVTLHIALNPMWNEKNEKTVVARFGAIENMEQVATFFQKVEQPSDRNRFIAEVVGLTEPKKNVFVLELEWIGSVEIHSTKLSLT
jgi:hypothetical protein